MSNKTEDPNKLSNSEEENKLFTTEEVFNNFVKKLNNAIAMLLVNYKISDFIFVVKNEYLEGGGNLTGDITTLNETQLEVNKRTLEILKRQIILLEQRVKEEWVFIPLIFQTNINNLLIN